MLSVDSIIFFVLAIYKDSVEQSEYGGFKSLFLCAYPSYWRNKKTNRQTSITNILCENTNNTFEMEQEADIEIVSTQLEAEIILNDIKKTYVPKNKAVTHKIIDNLSLKVYRGQITAILCKYYLIIFSIFFGYIS